jgi:uncharacterized protein DUF4232
MTRRLPLVLGTTFGVALLGACEVGIPQSAPASTVTVSAQPQPDDPTAGSGDDDPMPPCTADGVEAAIAPGEGPSPDHWVTSIVLTNAGEITCTVEGTSPLTVYTGGDGRPLPIEQTASQDGPPEGIVTVSPGEQASIGVSFASSHDGDLPADCREGGSFVAVDLPDDAGTVEAWPVDAIGLPPICGPVATTDWSFGGAPGVPPN